MNKFKVTESQEQIALFSWASMASGKYPELELLHHIPNGGKRNLQTAIRLKAEGVKPGVPDIFLPVSRGGKHGLYIELKAESGKATELQKQFIDAVRAQGYAAFVCVGWEKARDCIETYLRFGDRRER